MASFRNEVLDRKRHAVAVASGDVSVDVWLELPGQRYLFRDRSQWSESYQDSEVTTGLHRWGWLLRGVTDSRNPLGFDIGMTLMRSWIADCLGQTRHAQDAYSNAERIVNGALFVNYYRGWSATPPDVLSAFEQMAQEIARHIEYFPGDQTGNHAFNNGRGLFFAGVLTRTPAMISLAHAIFSERLPILVTKDGFLREASSHYHFLFTRWVLEVCWLAAESGQEKTLSLVRPYAEKLVARCWFFLVLEPKSQRFSMPFIGDISPDFPPQWLLSLPWSSLARQFQPADAPVPGGLLMPGWADLFGVRNTGTEAYRCVTECFPDSHWFRLVMKDLTVFCFAEPVIGRYRGDHKHNDLCGFMAFYRGMPAMLDPGRLDYTRSPLSLYGMDPMGHNSLLVNGLPPVPEGKSWFVRAYRAVRVKTRLHLGAETIALVIEHDGFNRLVRGKIDHVREIRVGNDVLEVIDRVNSRDPCSCVFRFHWSADRSVVVRGKTFGQEQNVVCRVDLDERLSVDFLENSHSDPIGGVCVSEYGLLEPCLTFHLHGDVAPPASSVIHRFSWSNS
ncbi:MAG: heparinase II/III family protein [Magnetococcales bacterium]|nr:heparinase II/III family protein [Magnetococcales bacterium]